MYECNLSQDALEKKKDILQSFILKKVDTYKFAVNLFSIAVSHITLLDSIIKKTIIKDFTNSVSFKVLSVTVLSILRIAVAELLFFYRLHNNTKNLSANDKKSLIIDEAVILTKVYAEDNVYKLVHALLDKAVIYEINSSV